MLAAMLALEVKIGGLAPAGEITLQRGTLVLREVWDPAGDKGGWKPPGTVSNSYDDEVSPRLAFDDYGVLWAIVNNLSATFWEVRLYYSTDMGLTWNYYTTVSGDSCNMQAPVLAYDPYKDVLLFAFTGQVADGSYQVGICAWDVIDTAQLSGFRYVCYKGVGDVSSPALAVERFHAPNYAFCSFKYVVDTVQYILVYRCTDLDSFNWQQVASWSGSGCYARQLWANASDRVVQTTFIAGPDTNNPVCAYYAFSTTRGDTWQLMYLDASSVGSVYSASSAAALGSDYAVWAVQINEDLYVLYSTDNGSSWPYGYWLEADTSVSCRTPLVLADGGQGKGLSAYFYLLTYWNGNLWFRMAPVDGTSAADSWVPPSGKNEFLIPDSQLADYSVWGALWPTQLHGTVVPTDGGYGLATIWTHEFSASDHDISYTRSEGALFMETQESFFAEEVRLLTPVSSGEVKFDFPPEWEGRELSIYDPRGSLLLKTHLKRVLRVSLPDGLYLWRTGKYSGKLMLAGAR